MKQAPLLIALCLPGACGLRFSSAVWRASLQPQLASIYVEPVAERDGYELRNQLIDLLVPTAAKPARSITSRSR